MPLILWTDWHLLTYEGERECAAHPFALDDVERAGLIQRGDTAAIRIKCSG